ncbi:arginine--tRNA ligase [Candidatus Wolfebacteria bacterium]|nr:MAG: arginine--tRNA ligase [Candidatus Wolfebacteria bacterium]
MIADKIKQAISEVLGGTFSITDVELTRPTELTHGDYMTNVAFATAKKEGKSPKEKADEIVSALEGKLPEGVARVEVAGPGFINFYLTPLYFSQNLSGIDGEYGKNDTQGGKEIMYEYTDPNPFKKFHIGHLMSNTIGESLARLTEFSGAKVIRANYQGDVGPHVAKAIWGKIQNTDMSWGEAYVFGSDKYDENKEAIDTINKQVYDKSNKEVNALYDSGRTESLEHFEEIYKKLGTKFDHYFFESEVAARGIAVVEKGLAAGIFEKSEGAVVYRGEKEGLHTRVFMTSQGLPTYETKELGLDKTKFEKEQLDHSVIVTASEQDGFFKVVLSAMSKVLPEVAKKTQHISHGMMRFADGKMSSRTGNVITGESLLAEVEVLITEKISDRELSDEEKGIMKSQIAVAAVKYSILRGHIGGDIVYDREQSVSFEGDSGVYLQYANTRAQSILKKAEVEGVTASVILPSDWETTNLERYLERFPEVVALAQNENAPHRVVTYLTELASAFNSFYAQGKIIDSANGEVSGYKLALTKAFSTVMKNGLWLLGIEAPERM